MKAFLIILAVGVILVGTGVGAFHYADTHLKIEQVDIAGKVVTALVTLVAAAIAASIAYRQWQTADRAAYTSREKLRLDLFDKRIMVYEKMEAICDYVMDLGPDIPAADPKHLDNIYEALNRAYFLFDGQALLDSLAVCQVSLEMQKISRIPEPSDADKVRWQALRTSILREHREKLRHSYQRVMNFGHLK